MCTIDFHVMKFYCRFIFLFLSLLSFFPRPAEAQQFFFLDARAKALAGVSATLKNSAYAFLNNPAHLTENRRALFSINVDQLFQYDQIAVSDYFPQIGGLGLAIGRLHTGEETDFIGFGIGREIYSGILIGIGNITYAKKSDAATEWELGVSFSPSSPRLDSRSVTGLSRFNFSATFQHITLSKKRFGPPLQFTLAGRYRAINRMLDLYVENHFRTKNNDFITAAELHTSEFITLRSGIANFNKNQFLFGFGINLSGFNLDFVYEKYQKQIQFSGNIQFGESVITRADRYYQRGLAQIKQNNLAEALSQFRKALIFKPDDEKIATTYSDVKLLYEKKQEKLYRNLQEAQQYEKDGEPLAALLRYLDIARQYPANEEVRLKVAMLKPATLYQFNEYKKTAIEIYQQGRLKQAQKIFQRLALVDDQDSTIQKYSRLIEKEIRQQAEEYFVRGFGYWGQKKYRAARRDFELVYELQPDYPKIKYFLEDAKKQIQLTQTAIDSLLLIAKEKEKLKQYTEAISVYGKILNIDPENGVARNALNDIRPKVESYIAGLFDRANKSFNAGEYFNTEALCRNILRIDPEKTAARELRNRSREKRRSRADELWQQGLKYSADDKYKLAGDLFREAIRLNGKQDKYVKALREAKLKAEKKSNWLEVNRLLESNQFVAAEKLIDELLLKYPDNLTYQEFRKKIRLKHERYATMLLQEGIRLYSQEKYQEAVKKFDQLLKINPQNQTAQEYRKRIKEKIQALKKLK